MIMYSESLIPGVRNTILLLARLLYLVFDRLVSYVIEVGVYTIIILHVYLFTNKGMHLPLIL